MLSKHRKWAPPDLRGAEMIMRMWGRAIGSNLVPELLKYVAEFAICDLLHLR